METLPVAFPHIAEEIFRYLDHKSLENCHKVCQSWNKILEKVKFIWTGKTNEHPGWIKLFNTMSFETISALEEPFWAICADFRKPKIHPIFCAVLVENIEIFKTLMILYPHFQELFLEHDTYSIFEFCYDRMSPFHFASKYGKLKIVELLLKAPPKLAYNNMKGDKNPANPYGWTALHVASAFGHFEIVKILLDNINGEKNPADMFSLDTPLHQASIYGYCEIVKILLENIHGDKNPGNEDGNTPLHWAARNGHLEVVKILLDNIEGEKNPANNFGFTPLHQTSNQEIINLIRSYL